MIAQEKSDDPSCHPIYRWEKTRGFEEVFNSFITGNNSLPTFGFTDEMNKSFQDFCCGASGLLDKRVLSDHGYRR
jgi:hypothetical protein